MKPLSTAQILAQLSALEAAPAGGAEFHVECERLAADLAQGLHWRRVAIAGATIVAIVLSVILHGETWDDTDLIITGVLIVALPALAEFTARLIFPSIKQRDRIEGIAPHFGVTTHAT